jgi:sporulation protein YlmC with PRC-barrel domain
MKQTVISLFAGALLLTGGSAYAQMSAGGSTLLTTVPASSKTVTDWYKQDVYDTSNNKIGTINDVLLDQNGQVSSVIVGVGGFLGAGEKDVAVSFAAIKESTRNGKSYLTIDTTRDALNGASGFKYDSTKTTWVPVSASR